ncbi:MAG: HIT family protein [Phyllobacteriaceae bacterium]|nr:HIT family protein [Phyllobacteriaceae bacterium]
MTKATYDTGNIFAKILRGELPCHKIHEDADTIAFMDIMPRGPGHCLVLPKKPARNLLDADADSLVAVARTVQTVARGAMKAFQADGVTINQYNETAGGQVVFHLHVHIIPRFDGIKLRHAGGPMEKPETLAEQAQMIRAALAQS